MSERPALTYEAFITLAQQRGFEMDVPHLQELFPEVEAMFQRIRLLDQVDTSNIQPDSVSIADDAVKSE